jgi:hypothetical protein
MNLGISNYQDTNKVILDLKIALENKCGEKLDMDKFYDHSASITLRSSNFYFRVYFSFIQARIYEDFEVPIEKRLSNVLEGFNLEKGQKYELASRSRGKVPTTEIPTEYYIEQKS